MNHRLLVPITLTALLGIAATPAPGPRDLQPPALVPTGNPVLAAGTFTQSGINNLRTRTIGPFTILDQTSAGTVTGTIQGTFTDVLRVTIRKNGTFSAKFTLTCTCTVNGKTGVLTLKARDRGRMVSPTKGEFAGRAVITKATGGLVGMRGSLGIRGSVDLTTGLSTYAYAGRLRTTP